MSRYSVEYLNNNTLIGFTGKRGNAWHRDLSLVSGGLDNHYVGAIPADEILSRLFPWEERIAPVFVEIDGQMVRQEDRKAIYRSDTGAVLGIHSEGYTPHSYRKWLVENLDRIVGGNAQYANAGLLAHGAQAWVQIEMPDNIDIPGGAVIRPFLLATTSFDGSVATTYKTGFTNVVCDNTFGMFMREAGETYRRKHTRNSEFSLLSAADAFGTLSLVAETVAADIETLLAVDVTELQWQKFVEAHAPIKADSSKRAVTIAENTRGKLTQLWRTDIRVAPWAGTAWGVIQAVNTFNEHMQTVRNVDPFERKMVRAVKGQIARDDSATVKTLSDVIGRELISI